MELRKELREAVLGKQERDFQIRAGDADKEARTVALSFSSESPVSRFWGIEILSHASGACRLDRLVRSGSLLENHEPEKRLGRILEARCNENEKKGRAVVRFSSSGRGRDVFQDVINDDWTTVSVGYMIHSARELKAEEMDNATKELALREQLPVVMVDDWEPYEISMVSVPADVTVGVGRSQSNNTPTNIHSQGRPAMAEEVKDPTPSPDKVLQQERERVAEITAIAAKHSSRVRGIAELRDKAIQSGMTVADFRGSLIDNIPASEPIDTPVSELGMTEKEKGDYSLIRLLRYAAAVSPQEREKVGAGIELEAHNALVKQLGSSNRGGFYVPYDIQRRGNSAYFNHPDYKQFLHKRTDLLTSAAATGGNIVGTTLQAGSFIELLRNKMLMTQLGVRMLTGLVGNVAIPKQTVAGTAVWTTEGTGVNSESAQEFGQVTLSPNEVGAYTDMSRKLLQQSTPGVEGLIQDDLSKVLALAIDKAILHGSGGTQPTGIVGASGVGSTSAVGLDWAGVVDFETDVATANADVASMAYVTTPAIYGELKVRPKQAGQPIFLLGENGLMNGYRCERTNQVTANYIFFGDFSQVILAEWGVLEIMVNPYRQDVEGLVRILAYQSVDVGVRQAGAFSVASDFS